MPKFICISGKAQHGKDTSAGILEQELIHAGKRVLVTHYGDLLKYICKTWFGWNGKKDNSGRTLLQRVGTDVVRMKRPNFWVNFILDVVGMFEDDWDYIIIPDTRFPNELNCIKEHGYPLTHIRVVRSNFESPLSAEQQSHISEIALDKELPDLLLRNDGSLEQLASNVRELVKQL